MNSMNEELLDLLAERALANLSPADEARLKELLDAAGLEDSVDMELAVAAAMNAFAGQQPQSNDAAVPESLKQKLHADADRLFGEKEPAAPVSDIEDARSRHTDPRRRSEPAPSSAARRASGLMGWAVAATLAIVVVLALRPDVEPAAPDSAAARAALIAEADTSVVEWGQSEIPAYNRVTGDVVWNDELQQGYLRLAGMPVNDPSISQYQLWIVDPDRDANPVDGGVFDIPPGAGEIIIPIRAKLEVDDPVAFAITREQPGGVVVSDGPLLIVAAS